MKEKIREFIINELLDESVGEFDNNTDIISSGLLDSLSIVKLLVFVEDTFDVSFDDSLELENFKSVNSISKLVEKKLK